MLRYVLCLMVALMAAPTLAQDRLTVATVTRPPFSMNVDGAETGFALDLWAAMAERLALDYAIDR
ncbi:MAG: glutamine ABC transporter substrate-binding protein, partial [Pseudomonadota bacterium]